MLVLSRRKNETIVFPSIGATVELLQIKGNVARIGVTAPRNVPVLRGELDANAAALDAARAAQSLADLALTDPAQAAQPQAKLSHDVRNLLNTTSVGLSLLRKQLQAGLVEDAQETLQRVLNGVADVRQKAESQTPRPRGGRRALLVEDNDNERHLLAGFLRTSGFAVDTVSDGQEAINYLSGESLPDVVLMDMLMPRCDGPQAVRVIRQNPRHRGLKIYAVSGADPNALGLTKDIDGWFQKPLDPEKFVMTISRDLATAN